MTLYNNRLDVTVTPALTASTETAIAALEKALEFTIEVSAEEMKRILKMGERSEPFVEKAREIAHQPDQHYLPKGYNVAAFDSAVDLHEFLTALEERLSPLMQKLRDSRMAAGGDVMQWSMIVYRSLKAHGEATGAGRLTAELGERFKKLKS